MLLISRFCGLLFGTARRSQKWDRENALLLFFYLAVHMVPKIGPPGGPIFGTMFKLIFLQFFASGLKKSNVLVSLGKVVAYGSVVYIVRNRSEPF